MSDLTEDHSAKKIHWPSVLQFALSSIAVIGVWTSAVFIGIIAVFQYYGEHFEQSDPASLMVTAAVGFFTGLLLLLSALLSGARLLGYSGSMNEIWIRIWRIFHPRRLIWLLPLVLLIGYWVSKQTFAWWLIAPFHIIASCIPLAWLVWLGGRGLKKGSPQRDWGVFTSGLVLGPFLVFIFEIVCLIVIGILFGIYISQHQEIMTELQGIMMQFQGTQIDADQLLSSMADFINSGPALSLVIVYLAIVVPLIEEAVKPLGVWLLGGRQLTCQEGLFIGMLSGAGFALYENFLSFNGATGWVLTVLVRLTTTVIHISTAGLTGWALVGVFKKQRYLQFFCAYFLSVIIHALWNANVVLFGFTFTLYSITGLSKPPLLPYHLQFSSPLFLVYLALAAFIWILLANQHLQGKEVVE